MRHLMIAIVAIGVVVTIVGVLEARPAAAWSADQWPDSAAEEDLLSDFQARAQAAGALGFYRDEATSSLVVLVPASRRTEYGRADLGQAPVPVTVKFSEIDPTALDVAFERLRAIGLERVADGDSLAIFFDPSIGRIQVETSLDEATVLGFLGNSRDLINYRHDGPLLHGRFSDLAPFWGGAAIDIKDYGEPEFDCTSGFAVVNGSGQKALVTAAHCGPVGKTVITPSFDRVVGTTGPKYCQEVASDVMLIKNKTYDNWIYSGAAATPDDFSQVTEYGTPAVGATYNVSGAATFAHGAQLVLRLDGQLWRTICDQVGYVSNLIVYTHRVNGVDTCETDLGDSGAPFYVKYGGGASAGIRGMHLYGSSTTCYAMLHSRIQTVTGYHALTN